MSRQIGSIIVVAFACIAFVDIANADSTGGCPNGRCPFANNSVPARTPASTVSNDNNQVYFTSFQPSPVTYSSPVSGSVYSSAPTSVPVVTANASRPATKQVAKTYTRRRMLFRRR